jgi:riboflavin kinase / FMN adenylyltransferase
LNRRKMIYGFLHMIIQRDYGIVSQSLCHAVMAIGNFDSVHIGHRAVLEQAKALAVQQGVPCVAMTFHPHPRCYFAPDAAPRAIEPLTVRIRRLRALGIDGLLMLRFNAALADMDAETFIHKIVVDKMQVSHVVVGEDFRFGAGRGGDIHFLQEQAVQHRFGFTYVPPMMLDDSPISSTRIRALLTEGNMAKAARLLGRPYQIIGRVVHGEKRGREMKTPTANLRVEGLHMPRFGVYAVMFAVLEGTDCETYPPQWQQGVANLGIRPTFGEGNVPLLEVHGFTSLPPCYGKTLRVRLMKHLRDECTFDSQASLMAQITQDIAAAKSALCAIDV